jgi:hypothetical protein
MYGLTVARSDAVVEQNPHRQKAFHRIQSGCRLIS